MKKYSNDQKAAWISLGVLVLFLILFFTASALMQNGMIPTLEFSQAVQGVLSFIFLLPLLSALFFTGQHLKHKAGKSQIAYQILTFISIALFVFGFVQMLLSIVGIIIKTIW